MINTWKVRLWEYLISEKILNNEQLKTALDIKSHEEKYHLWEIIARLWFLSQVEVANLLFDLWMDIKITNIPIEDLEEDYDNDYEVDVDKNLHKLKFWDFLINKWIISNRRFSKRLVTQLKHRISHYCLCYFWFVSPSGLQPWISNH